MLYHFELQLAGVILLTTMAICAISLYIKRRRESRSDINDYTDDEQFSSNT